MSEGTPPTPVTLLEWLLLLALVWVVISLALLGAPRAAARDGGGYAPPNPHTDMSACPPCPEASA